jgi:isopenicillin-N N-acyltransferase-like protein
MKTFPLIEIEGRTSYERGTQYGEMAKRNIRAGIEGYKYLFAQIISKSWDELVEYSLSYVPDIQKTMPEIWAEAQGVAAGAGVTMGELMLLNCRYEITKFGNENKKDVEACPEYKECTTCAILPEAAEEGKTLLVKNWDYRAGILDNIVVLHIKELEKDNRILGLAEAGQLIREGFNSGGIGLCSNSLQSVDDHMGIGIPVTFLRRKVLACSVFEEAKSLLLNSRRTVSNNMLLASKDGKAIDIEAHPGGADLMEPQDGLLCHANHFEVTPKRNFLQASPRKARLEELLRKRLGTLTIDYIKQCLSDHQNYPHAICRHPSEADRPLARRSMTVASMIVDFQESVAHICAGPPCEGEFVRYEL